MQSKAMHSKVFFILVLGPCIAFSYAKSLQGSSVLSVASLFSVEVWLKERGLRTLYSFKRSFKHSLKLTGFQQMLTPSLFFFLSHTSMQSKAKQSKAKQSKAKLSKALLTCHTSMQRKT